MIKYKNPTSGIDSYEIGEDYIKILFKSSNRIYKYNYLVAGKFNVDKMKKLAELGYGLNTYINEYKPSHI